MPDAPDITLDDLIDWIAVEVAGRLDTSCEIDHAAESVSSALRLRIQDYYWRLNPDAEGVTLQ